MARITRFSQPSISKKLALQFYLSNPSLCPALAKTHWEMAASMGKPAGTGFTSPGEEAEKPSFLAMEPASLLELNFIGPKALLGARMLNMAGKRILFPALAVFLTFLTFSFSQEDVDNKIQRHLAVQKALQEGEENLRKGNYPRAVAVLESQLDSINGNREFLETLANAYRGYLKELNGTGTQESARIARRLNILEGGMGSQPRPEKKVIPTNPPAKSNVSQTEPKTRAKIEGSPNEDIFSHTNSEKFIDATRKLQFAEEEFAKNNFRIAGRLFAEASLLEARVLEKSLERWAYCRLHSVVESMNSRPEAHDPAWGNEIRVCIAMAPQMQPFGKQLLGALEARGPSKSADAAPAAIAPPVDVRHFGPQSNGFSLAQTRNFRVWHKLSPQDAAQIAKAAEAFRAEAAMKWFGSVGEDWTPICELFLHTNAQEYAKATGAPAASPGHSTLRTEGSRVLARRIDLRLDDTNLMIGVLPHETTHVVLAGRLGDQPVPRWADEGMSVLAEPRSRIQRHLENLPRHAKERALFSCEQLFKLDDYPEARLVGPFYAQSVAVVDYLVKLKGPRAFAEFMREGLKSGYEPALRKHYGIDNFAGLDQRWWPTSGLAAAGN